MGNSPFEQLIDSIDSDEGVYGIDNMRAAYNTGADFARDIADETIGALQAHIEAEPSDKVEAIRIKDEALAAARELIHIERETLMEPEGELGQQYESVLAMISNALIQS